MLSTADGDSFSALDSDIVNITGTVVDNDASADCDVKVEASLDDISVFDKSEGIKTAQKALGRFDWQDGLCDGDQYFLSLNISHLYLELDGNADHRRGEDHGERVRRVRARDVGRRAVDGLEDAGALGR